MDKYDEAVEYLTANPDEIREAWNNALDDDHPPQGCELFKNIPGKTYCLTQLKKYVLVDWLAPGDDAAVKYKELLEDPLIPSEGDLIMVEHLPRFAYWQRKIRG